MKRPILAFIAALATWVLIASLLDRGLRAALDGYAAAEPTMTFTFGMMLARLVIGALASLAAGAAIGWIAPRSSRTPWVFGILWLAAFIPEHLKLWHLFPVWYHLTFLLTLVPLVIVGSMMVQARVPEDTDPRAP